MGNGPNPNMPEITTTTARNRAATQYQPSRPEPRMPAAHPGGKPAKAPPAQPKGPTGRTLNCMHKV